MTRALLVWLLAAVLSLLAGILAALGWRVLVALDDAWDVTVDAERVNARVSVPVSGGIFVTDAYTGGRSAFDDAHFRLAERMAVELPRTWGPGSPA